MTDEKGLRSALRAKMNWSASSLSNAVTGLVDKHKIAPRSDALLTLALLKGVPLGSFGVDGDSQRRASELARMVSSQTGETSVQGSRSTSGLSVSAPKVVKVEVKGVSAGTMPSFMSSYGGGNHERSRSGYQLVYLFENSVREVIMRVLKKEHGNRDWWDKGVDPKIIKTAKKRKADDKLDPWHEPRGTHLIYYIDLYHYTKIITSDQNWKLFEPIFTRKGFVEETLHQVNVSRRVVAHMNGLKKADYDSLKVNFDKWNKVVVAAESLLA